MKRELLALCGVLVLMTLAMGSCAAQPEAEQPESEETQPEPIELSYAGYHSATYLGVERDKMLLDDLEKRAADIGIPVEVTYHLDGTIATSREILDVLLAGGCDIAEASPAHYEDRFPIYLTWGGFLRVRTLGIAQYEEIRVLQDIGWYDFPLQEEKEMKPKGLTALWVGSTMEYQFISGVPVETLSDFDGLKVRRWSAAYDPMWEAAGAVPVAISSGEVYEGLDRGTIDGSMYSYGGAVSKNWHDVASDVTRVYIAVPLSLPMMALERMESLPPEIQAILEDLRVEARERSDQFLQERQTKDKQILEDAGLTFRDLPAEDLAEWKERMGDQRESTLEAARERGVEAEVKEILDFLEPILQKYEQELGVEY